MSALWKWLIENQVVLFSGIGVAAIGWIVNLLRRRPKESSSQMILSGKKSTNIQAGGDVKIGTPDMRKDGEEE